MLFNYESIHVELSSKCVLKCPRCPRTELASETLNQEISLADFKIGFPALTLDKIKCILFCGDIGDPIYATEFLDIIEYIKKNSSICVRIVTNGSYKKDTWWQALGNLLDHNDHVTFSVDGWDNNSNNLYRVNSDFDSIIAGIQTLRASSECCIQWSAIYFEFNQERIDQIKSIATSVGCNEFKTVKSSKFDNTYIVNGIDSLKPKSDLVAKTSMYESVKEILHPSNYQPVVNPSPITLHAWAKCLNFKKELFIGVNGIVLPCPWFNSGYIENAFVVKNSNRLNIRTRSLFEIINDQKVWQDLLDSFENNPLKICEMKCKNG